MVKPLQVPKNLFNSLAAVARATNRGPSTTAHHPNIVITYTPGWPQCRSRCIPGHPHLDHICLPECNCNPEGAQGQHFEPASVQPSNKSSLLTTHYQIIVKSCLLMSELGDAKVQTQCRKGGSWKALAASLVLAPSDMSGDSQLDARMDTQRRKLGRTDARSMIRLIGWGYLVMYDSDQPHHVGDQALIRTAASTSSPSLGPRSRKAVNIACTVHSAEPSMGFGVSSKRKPRDRFSVPI